MSSYITAGEEKPWLTSDHRAAIEKRQQAREKRRQIHQLKAEAKSADLGAKIQHQVGNEDVALQRIKQGRQKRVVASARERSIERERQALTQEEKNHREIERMAGGDGTSSAWPRELREAALLTGLAQTAQDFRTVDRSTGEVVMESVIAPDELKPPAYSVQHQLRAGFLTRLAEGFRRQDEMLLMQQ